MSLDITWQRITSSGMDLGAKVYASVEMKRPWCIEEKVIFMKPSRMNRLQAVALIEMVCEYAGSLWMAFRCQLIQHL
jgi:hypothetical protein